jgi:hypothetical protein
MVTGKARSTVTAIATAWKRLCVTAITPFGLLLIAMLVFAIGACKRDNDPQREPSKPDWLRTTSVSVSRQQKAFDENSEVFIALHNESKSPVVIQGLARDDGVTLVHEGGSVAKIHKISVGVSKPIVVAPGEKKRTSLLFEAAPGRPVALRLYGKDYPLP